MRAPEPGWAVVVPVKGGPLAKSRLDLPVGARAVLAEAFARDTVAALVAADDVRLVLVVTADPGVRSWVPAAGGLLVADPGGGLDAAVAAGVRAAHGAGAGLVAVVLGDHPALRSEEVTTALGAAAAHERAVLADADGTGTALLTGPTGAPLPTAFGAGSAQAHASLGYVVLDLDLPGLRVDVDDAASLARATLLGLGPATREALGRATLPGVQATIHRIEDDGSGSALLDDGVEVVLLPGAATSSGLRHLRVGQRVSVELDDAGRAATRVWIVGIGPGETIR
ncbi:2-phospho-L-lactate guanylyltransferase [Oryzobacter telluris]|uniref:2-phospho-L-lactate guanylyltransferase n=1 Tax=Oryzobacter telluris TaxID=3149179 RepID=UPI00370DA777